MAGNSAEWSGKPISRLQACQLHVWLYRITYVQAMGNPVSST
jgi:hypothetical protein